MTKPSQTAGRSGVSVRTASARSSRRIIPAGVSNSARPSCARRAPFTDRQGTGRASGARMRGRAGGGSRTRVRAKWVEEGLKDAQRRPRHDGVADVLQGDGPRPPPAGLRHAHQALRSEPVVSGPEVVPQRPAEAPDLGLVVEVA